MLSNLFDHPISYVTPANIGPYQLARFKKLACLWPNLSVIRVARGEHYRPWKLCNQDLGVRIIPALDDNNHIAGYERQFLFEALEKEDPSVLIIVGYGGAIFRDVARWGKSRGIPCILTSDSWKFSQPRSWYKELAKLYFIRRLYDSAFVSGSLASEYISSLGMKSKYIWRGYDVVDNEHFQRNFSKKTKVPRLPKSFFLCVIRLSSTKNLLRMIKAFELYRRQGGTWHLCIVGTGPQEQELKRSVSPDIKNFVHWLGWKQYEELPSLYAAASCYIQPSIFEEWGLAINEAMAAGLPILVSRKCGCHLELCWRGINGYDFDPYDVSGLAELMLKMSSSQVDLTTMGQASRRIISNFSPETWAAALTDCIIATMSRLKKRMDDVAIDVSN